MRAVAVTGIGAALPGGPDLASWWSSAVAGTSAITDIDRFDPQPYPCARAGSVDDQALEVLPRRTRKRMDRFCQLGLVAVRDALADADIDVDDLDPTTVGTYMGNMFGGWEITEPSLRRLSTEGYTGVSPYVASAWFPTAIQGQASIEWGLRGFSKTVSTDTASGLLALGYAAQAIADGRAEVMVCGGAEAPITPYTYTFCTTSGRLSSSGYRPYAAGGDGFVVGEGAVTFVLESLDAARARGARVYGLVAGHAVGHVPAGDRFTEQAGVRHADVITSALRTAEVDAADVAYVGLDAEGDEQADRHELAAVGRALGPAADQVVASTVKTTTGHLLGAAPAAEAAAALLALTHRQAPTLVSSPAENSGLPLSTRPRTTVDTGAAVAQARGADGTVAAAVLVPA